MLTFIEEETFFSCLTMLHHAFCGIIVSVLLGDFFLYLNKSHASTLWESSCSKMPVLWKESQDSFANNVFTSLMFALVILIVIFQILLFKRQRQVERQADEGIITITYNREGVSISTRSPNLQASQQLRKHNRTVVTPKASFLSFLLTLLSTLGGGIIFFTMNSEGPSIYGQFILFTQICVFFFLNTLVETIFSPRLCNSLLDFLPGYQRIYHVLDV